MNVALHNNIDAFRIGKLCFSVGLEPQPITLVFASIEGIAITSMYNSCQNTKTFC